MKDPTAAEGVSVDQNMFPDALTEPEGDLLRAVFRGAPCASRLARAPGGWRTLSLHELDALELSDDEREAVLALQELVRRSYPRMAWHTIVNSAAVASLYGDRLGDLMHEVMFAIALDGRNRFVAEVQVAMGGLHRLSVQPRDVIRPLLRAGATAFILVHNHPGGDPTPSEQDITMTRAMVECANAVGVPMVDHVIIGGRGGGYSSLLDLGVIERAGGPS
jgi:DNA repair protein RadC